MSRTTRRRWPRNAALLSALAATCVAFGACGSSGGSGGSDAGSAKKTTITFSYLWGGKEGQEVEKLIREFNASQSKIVVKGVSNPDAQAQLAAMSSTKGSFDISDNFGSNVGSWASKGIIEPLDSYMQEDGYDTGDFIPAAMQQMGYQGRTYALPVGVHTSQLIYNKRLFKQAGIAAPPRTTSEMARDVDLLTKRDGDTISQLGWASQLGGPADLTTLGFLFGGQWFDADGNPTPDADGNLAGAKFYVDTVPAKYGAGQVQRFISGFGEYASPQNPFFTGKVAMAMEGEWMSAFSQQFARDLDWGAAPLPYPDGHPELAGTTQLTASDFFIPRNAQHKQEAWEFMKFLLDKRAMAEFTHTLANLPARTSLLDDPVYDDMPNFDVWLASLKSDNVKVLASVPVTQEYMTGLFSAFDSITRMTRTPSDALGAVASKFSG